jgi:hypothetical protein
VEEQDVHLPEIDEQNTCAALLGTVVSSLGRLGFAPFESAFLFGLSKKNACYPSL